MLPAEDLFVHVSVMVDDATGSGAIAIPPRPGPTPGCSDAEILAMTIVRLLLGRRSGAGFLAEVLPHHSEVNRPARWPWGAVELFRAAPAAGVPDDDGQQVDTPALPVKHTSRARGPDC